MIDDALIVKDTRKVRHAISKKFNNDIDKYLDYPSGRLRDNIE